MSVSLSQLTLYHFTTCPFCIRVRHCAHQLGLDLAMKNVRRDPQAREELAAGGGRTMVPCLRTDHPDGSATWMYESRDICAFLRQTFGP